MPDEPGLENFDGIKPDDLPPEAQPFFEKLRKASKDWEDNRGNGKLQEDIIKKYKEAASDLIKYINSFIKNEDFGTIEPDKMRIIKQGLQKFNDWYNKLKPGERGDDTLDGNAIKFGMKEIFENLLKNINPDDYELGEDGAFTQFLKKVGVKSSDFNELAKKYLNKSDQKTFDKLMNSYKKLFEKVGKQINKGEFSEIRQPDLDSINTLSNSIDQLLKKAEAKYKSDEQAKNPNSKTGNSTLSHLVKFFALLEILGGGIMAWWLIKQYCDNHSGCLKIEYNAGASYVQNNKKYCAAGTLPPTGFSQTTTYGPEQCYCSQYVNNPMGDPTQTENCAIFTSNKENHFTPDNTIFEAGSACNPPNGNISNISLDGSTSFMYYSYIVMTPFDGLINIADKTADITKNTIKDIINMIVHAVIILAIVGGVLLVLYIVYKVVANRKPTEAIKIETDSSKFGNILGNLNKFSRYNMKPVKFGNRFNF